MQNVIKKQLPTKLAEKLANPRSEDVFNTYYDIDGAFYVYTQFYVEEDNPSLTLLHDMAFLEAEMIKELKAKNKVYFDEENKPFFDLYHLGLWFYERIPSKDWQDLLNFLRLIKEHEKVNSYITIPSDEPPAH